MAGESVLAKMAVEIVGNTAQFAKSMSAAQKDLKGFTDGAKNIASTLSGAFAAREVASFAFEVSKLAGEAEGVRKAFDKLPNSIGLMNDLKRATSGTVSELDLMKRSVQAANFGISLQALPKLLEFAAVRAQQTGQSVDYLVDSIVTGIGRKSPLILDNLGISAVALKEKMGDVSLATADVGTVAEAVGKIATEQLATMGSMVDTNATKTQRLTASWTNFKVALGDAANGTGILGKSLDALSLTLDVAASKNISFWETLAAFASGPGQTISAFLGSMATDHEKAAKQATEHEQVVREVDKAFKEFGPNIEAYSKAISTHTLKTQLLEEYTRRLNSGNQVQIKTLTSLQESLKLLNGEFENLDVNNTKQLQATALKIISINKEIEAIEKLRKAQEQLQQMQTKFGKETLNKGPDAIGINGVDPNDLLLKFDQPEGLKDMFPTEAVITWGDTVIKTLTAVDGIYTELDKNNEIRNARDMARFTAQQEQLAKSQQMWLDLGASISNSISQAISANESFATTLARIAKKIVGQMLAIALANAIAKSYESTKNPIVGTILAGAASAAVIGLFDKIPIGGGSSGAGGSASRPSVNSSTIQSYNPSPQGQQVVLVQGEFRMKGNDLALVVDKAYKSNGRLGGLTG